MERTVSVNPTPTRCRSLAALLLALSSCQREPPPGAESTTDRSEAPRAGSPVLPRELAPPAPGMRAGGAPAPSNAPSAGAAPSAPYTGPWLAVTEPAAGVYSEMSFERSKKLGYLRSGGRAPIEPDRLTQKNCTAGWYKLRSGGYICANYGTTNLNNAEVKFATTQPNVDEVLPYPYARNAKNGTPLYHTVPSREQMERYEPYLKKPEESDKPEADKSAGDKPVSDKSDVRPATSPADVPLLGPDAGAPPAAESPDPEPDKPWWQREDAKDKLHELKLEQLSSDADDVLAKRMVSGFYVAVDKTFKWNGRTWYKTTKGLVAPADRFWQTQGSTFKGVELDGQTYKLPIGWVYGGSKNAGTYAIDTAADTIKNAKSIDRFVAIPLTGKTIDFHGKDFVELADGSYMRKSQLRVTEPGPPPEGLQDGERYIDVDLSSQTLVAYEGSRPVYATLISSGKESKIKDKDHSTPTGEWRIREKHITTTMDGDGTAAGDLPYSIEDVPYVMYFHRSYALHGAFWHGNFGVQMSHGCVNLAPLDAKWLFFFVDPKLPEGFHGVWSNERELGTRVVIHD